MCDRDASESSDFDLQIAFKPKVSRYDVEKAARWIMEWYFDTSRKSISFSRALAVAIGQSQFARLSREENKRLLEKKKKEEQRQ